MKKRNARSDGRVSHAQDKAENERKKSEIKKQKAAVKAEEDRQKSLRRAEISAVKTEKLKVRQQKRRKVYGKIKTALKNDPNGFDYSNVGILPRVELIVDGGGSEIAMKFGREGIDVSDMVKNGRITRFKIRKKDMRKAIAILEQMCYNFKVGKTFGITRTLAFIPARIGLSLGILASMLALNISYSYIWRVQIDGNDRVSSAAVISALESAGIKSGIKKDTVDAKSVASAVNTLDGVADASCEVVGTTLKIRILESDDYTVPERYTSYVSKYDATVTRIVMRKGTALVKRGDIVKSGDLLADGSVYSTAGELMYVGEPDGDIYGNVSITYTVRMSSTAVEYRRTGNSVKKTSFRIFGFSVFEPKSPYTSYETVASTANYDVLIPLYVTAYEFFETAPVEVECDIDALAKDFASEKAEEAEMTDGKFDATYTVSQSVGGMYDVHVFLSGEARISVGA